MHVQRSFHGIVTEARSSRRAFDVLDNQGLFSFFFPSGEKVPHALKPAAVTLSTETRRTRHSERVGSVSSQAATTCTYTVLRTLQAEMRDVSRRGLINRGCQIAQVGALVGQGQLVDVRIVEYRTRYNFYSPTGNDRQYSVLWRFHSLRAWKPPTSQRTRTKYEVRSTPSLVNLWVGLRLGPHRSCQPCSH